MPSQLYEVSPWLLPQGILQDDTSAQNFPNLASTEGSLLLVGLSCFGMSEIRPAPTLLYVLVWFST